jgi:hypothetical protein
VIKGIRHLSYSEIAAFILSNFFIGGKVCPEKAIKKTAKTGPREDRPVFAVKRKGG